MTDAVPPEQVLGALKNDARPQKRRALDVVNAVCAELHKIGGRDFSVATIGRLSEQRGGPSMRTLYNAQSEHYRILIKAWAECARAAAGTSAGAAAKPLAEDDLLRRIPDPALRALFGTIVAERNRLRSEINVLRSHTNIVVDRRVLPGNIAVADGQITQVLTPGDRLLPMEREALARAISFKFLEQEGWREGPNGEILNAKGRKLFELGYGTATSSMNCPRFGVALRPSIRNRRTMRQRRHHASACGPARSTAACQSTFGAAPLKFP